MKTKHRKTSKKHVVVILMILMIMVALNTASAFANPAGWVTSGGTNSSLDNVNQQVETGGRSILNLVTTFGNVAGLIILSIYGIKWFLSRNDSSARKDLKDQAIGYVVGSIIFFGAIPLYKIIHSFAKAFEMAP